MAVPVVTEVPAAVEGLATAAMDPAAGAAAMPTAGEGIAARCDCDGRHSRHSDRSGHQLLRHVQSHLLRLMAKA
jgi:hypothetical protein